MSSPRIYVAGHKGMVGSALVRLLEKKNTHLITKNKEQLNLTKQSEVQNFFQIEKPDQVYLAAAKVGGIYANNMFPAEFIYENTMIESNIIHSAFLSGVKKILFLGSSCIYPKFAIQPMKEESLLNGLLEPTNEPYAIAKILGIKLCESYNRQYGVSHDVDYRSIMPTNLYGPGDNYHIKNSHVIPSLIRKFHHALIKKEPKVIVWGTGSPRREFLHVDDLARAAYHVMNLNRNNYNNKINSMCSHLNVGYGSDLTIKELAENIKEIVDYRGLIEFDSNEPDGMPKKLLNSSKINDLGWEPKIDLKEGLIRVYESYKENLNLKK
jgi:GDP-L-fucose synthase